MYLGRVVEADEPLWLPEDRDVLAVWLEFKRSRHSCGRWQWEYDDFDGFVLDYDVCPFCREVGRTEDRVRSERPDMYGVHFGFFPPEEVTDGD